MAERDGAETVAFPDALMAAAEDDPEIAQQIAGQRELFTARRASVERTVEQLREQTAQIENQIAGIEAQLSGLGTQRTLVEEELADKESLLERGLTQRSQVSTLRRELARLVGEIGALEAEIARARGQIAGLNIEILKLDTTRREEAISRLRDLRAREAQLAETLRGLEARQERLTVRAPVSGVVHGSEVFAVKSVVQAGAPLMYIIPQDQPLVVAVRLQPIRIDEVRLGQEAGLRFTAFDQRTTPEIAAYVSELSADVLVDEATGATFYRAELIPREGEMARLGAQPLVPGMPVEAYIHTGERTPLSYLLKPLTDYFNRAMRE
jgi:HlyD family secretion protein